MRALTYAAFYERAYRTRALDTWVCRRLSPGRALRTRLHTSSHLLTLARTQTLGAHIAPETVALAHRVHRLSTLGARHRLRTLQRRILQHLWRPCGTLAARNAPSSEVFGFVTDVDLRSG